MNRILVTANGKEISAQARTYAEYRVFSTLTQHVPGFREACVVLRRLEPANTYDTIACEVTVALEPAGTLRVRATGPHVYAAINTAIERLTDLVGVDPLEERRLG
jgi:ribosome-associated translation inhibitor RaiA